MTTRVAVITGGSKGIGRALVHQFCSEGYAVFTCSRTGDDLDELETAMEELPGNLQVKVADLSRRTEVLGFAEFVKSECESIDVLVNNVGVFIPGMLTDEPQGQLERQIETNLYSAYYLTRALLPVMKSGHIFNICSTASLNPYENGSSYSISKYALLGFSHNLREELKTRGIGVTAVLPGNTLTPSWGETDIPEDKFIKSEDVAKSVYGITQLSPNTAVEEILIQPQFKRQ